MSRYSLRTDYQATKRWWLVVRRACLPFLIALAAPLAARGEAIYAFALDGSGNFDHRLLRFDSASPWELEQALPINGELIDVTQVSLEFDPVTRELYAFGFWQCQVLCPPTAIDPMRIDPLTGDLVHLAWPGLPAIEFGADKDIHPLTRELRLFSQSGGNFRYSIESLELHVDQSLNIPGYAYSVAHMPTAEEGGGVETFAIFYQDGEERRLVRIGGVGGVPPASSGEVTVIGPVDVQGEVAGFDISASGEAFLSTYDSIQLPGSDDRYVSWLYTIDLETGATQELGTIATQPSTFVSGIAVAPPGLVFGAPEIPALSRTGLATFVLFLAIVALWRSRLYSS